MPSRYAHALSVYQDTSREAWDAFQSHLGRTDARIVAVLRRRGGTTCDVVERETGLKHQTVSAQLRHMVEAGIVRDSGRRAPTQGGRPAIVWIICPPAAEHPRLFA